MKGTIQLEDRDVNVAREPRGPAPSYVAAALETADIVTSDSANALVIGELVGLKDDGRTALVMFPGQRGSAAVSARSIVDLYGRHIGRQLALVFENGNAAKPIVVGVLREGEVSGLETTIGPTAVEADGERLIVTAKEQLILRCGSASITLTKEGKILIQGTFVSSRSAGVNRIVGGSVQIN